MGQKGACLGQVIYLSNFGIPLIPPEWLKIQISNFVCGLMVRDTKQKMKNGPKGGAV